MNHALLPRVGSASLPAKYEAAKLALSECNQIDECKDWADKSQALASYARQSKDKEMEKTALRIRARAVRRCGELLKEVAKGSGGRPSKTTADTDSSLTRKQAAKEAGLSERQQHDALRVANVNGHSFEEQIESEDPPTITALAKQGKAPPKGIPLYEKLGMTKQAFQAGMYFRGDIELYIEAMSRHAPQDVADGSTKEQRKEIKANLKQIEKYHDELRSKL